MSWGACLQTLGTLQLPEQVTVRLAMCPGI